MPTTVNLRRLFDFSTLPIVITGAVLAALTVAIVLILLYNLLKDVKKKEKVVEEAPQPVFVKSDLTKLKAEYMEKLNKIEIKYNEDTTKIRPAYEGMSKVVREFVYKATGTEVDKFTLAEISRTEFAGLAKLVGEYYQPEFDQISEGDVRASLEKTRRLVAEWN
ncbi:MAG: hypothetical protein J5777_01935 [Clostridiales bacterium]|nr:hypothetical protein [Clostridiales bacterium]